MNRLTRDKQIHILSLMVEGSSLRAASRLADCSINTVTKLLVDAGTVCTQYQDKVFKNLSCKRLQADEIWSFCYAKAKNLFGDSKELKKKINPAHQVTVPEAVKIILSAFNKNDKSETPQNLLEVVKNGDAEKDPLLNRGQLAEILYRITNY